MTTVAEVEKLALELPEEQRAVLAQTLLSSLSPEFCDDPEGLAEALRRDEELEANPAMGISFEELDRRIRARWS